MGWDKYVQQELRKETTLAFSSAELEVIESVLDRLTETNQTYCWYELPVDTHRMIVRGYFDRKDNVKDTTKAVKDIHEFRKKYDVENIFKARLESHDLYHDAWPSYIAGEDIWGHWIVFESIEEWNLKLFDDVPFDKLLRYRTQHLEALMEIKRRISIRMGTRISRYIQILDMKGFSYTKHMTAKSRGFIKAIFGVQGDIYPETLWKMFCINVPYTFNVVWRIIQPWLDDMVIQKIKLIRAKKDIIPSMKACSIPIESIPKVCGGKSELVRMSDVIDELIDNPEGDETESFTTNRMLGPESPNTTDIINETQIDTITNNKHIDLEDYTDLQEVGGKKTDTRKEKNPFFNDEDVIMRGYLSKRGKYNKSWKRRFFVLVPHCLYYFSKHPSSDTTKYRGKIDLIDITRTRPVQNNGDGDGDDYQAFNVITPYRTYNFRVDDGTAEDRKSLRDHWMQSISLAAEEQICSLRIRKDSEKFLRNGFLEKRGLFNTAYKRRYFVLSTQHLYYYTDKYTNVGTMLKGKIDLVEVEKVEKVTSSDARFCIHTPYRIYNMKAGDQDNMEEWIQDISEAVDAEKRAKVEGEKMLEEEGIEVESTSSIARVPSVDLDTVRNSLDEEQETGQIELDIESDNDSWKFQRFSFSSIGDNIINTAHDLLRTARSMNVLVNPETGSNEDLPSDESLISAIRDRVSRMFLMSFGREKLSREETEIAETGSIYSDVNEEVDVHISVPVETESEFIESGIFDVDDKFGKDKPVETEEGDAVPLESGSI